MSAEFRFEDVSFAYDTLQVISHLSLETDSGEMVALLGANGSGKTTLLRLASGVLQPRMGRITLKGREVGSYRRRELARILSVLPQEVSVPAVWSVREVVSLGRTPHISLLGSEGREDIEAVSSALEATDSTDLADAPFDTLSGGQKQRVALAMALAQQPRVLLLDEPAAHLDIRYRTALMDAILELKSRLNLTVIAAIHDPNLAAMYFERIVLMCDGTVLADGSPEETLREDLLERTYGVPVRVRPDELLRVPVVSVLPARYRTNGVQAREITGEG